MNNILAIALAFLMFLNCKPSAKDSNPDNDWTIFV